MVKGFVREIMNKKRIFDYVIMSLIIIGILIRLSGINDILYSAESDYTFSSKYFSNILGDNDRVFKHPPLTMILFSLSKTIFGHNSFSYRVVPFVFGILSIIFTYLLAKKMFGKKSAYFSTLLMVFLFYSTSTSLRVDWSGSIIIFFFLSSFYFFREYVKNKKRLPLVLSATSVAFAMLTNYASVLLFVILGLYALNNIKLRENGIILFFKDMSIFFLTFLLIFSIFPIMSFLTYPSIFLRTFLTQPNRFSFIPNLKIFAVLFILIGPLLLGTFLLAIPKVIKLKKELAGLITWLVLPLLLYFFTKPYITIERYLVIVIVPLCLICGYYLSTIDFSRKDFYIFFITFAFWFIVIFNLNQDFNFVNHSISSYISNVLNFQWKFYLPITSRTGPEFGVSFLPIGLSLILSGILFIFCYLTLKNHRLFNKILSIFIGVSLALNMLLLQSYLLPLTTPDYSKVTYDMIDYFNDKQYDAPIYSTNFALIYHLKIETNDFIPLYGESAIIGSTNVTRVEESIKFKKGTIFAVNFPYINPKKDIWKTITNCKLSKEFYSNGWKAGYLFIC